MLIFKQQSKPFTDFAISHCTDTLTDIKERKGMISHKVPIHTNVHVIYSVLNLISHLECGFWCCMPVLIPSIWGVVSKKLIWLTTVKRLSFIHQTYVWSLKLSRRVKWLKSFKNHLYCFEMTPEKHAINFVTQHPNQ